MKEHITTLRTSSKKKGFEQTQIYGWGGGGGGGGTRPRERAGGGGGGGGGGGVIQTLR